LKGLIDCLKTRKTVFLREPLLSVLGVGGSLVSQASKGFHVRYIDHSTGRIVDKTISDVEQYDLYSRAREGKISIIEIRRAT